MNNIVFTNSMIITSVIITWILILFFLSIRKKSKRNYKNEIVSLGVLGTFMGISLGLFNFDAVNLKDSMPHLLDGLKTAFITSGVGIFFSIIISIIKPNKTAKISLDTISENQLKIIETLEKSLTEISKSANEEIINSLEKVVNQFNKNITEEFGQNFKELNSAIKNMILWQDNYKSQIKDSEENLNIIFANLEHISNIKEKQEKDIENIINNLSKTSTDVTNSLKKSTEIVEESLQLLLREANGKL